jgi:hypothetical protein
MLKKLRLIQIDNLVQTWGLTKNHFKDQMTPQYLRTLLLPLVLMAITMGLIQLSKSQKKLKLMKINSICFLNFLARRKKYNFGDKKVHLVSKFLPQLTFFIKATYYSYTKPIKEICKL